MEEHLQWIQQVTSDHDISLSDLYNAFPLIQLISILSPSSIDLSYYTSEDMLLSTSESNSTDIHAKNFELLESGLRSLLPQNIPWSTWIANIKENQSEDDLLAVCNKLKDWYDRKASDYGERSASGVSKGTNKVGKNSVNKSEIGKEKMKTTVEESINISKESVRVEVSDDAEEDYEASDFSFKPAVRWIIHMISDQQISLDFRQKLKSFEAELEKPGKIIPFVVIRALCSGEIYQNAIGLISKDNDFSKVSKFCFLDVLMDLGALKFKKSMRKSVEEMVKDVQPFYESVHFNILESFMNVSTNKLTIPRIVRELQFFPNFDSESVYPYDIEDALTIWINLNLNRFHEVVGEELEVDDIVRGFAALKVAPALLKHYDESEDLQKIITTTEMSLSQLIQSHRTLISHINAKYNIFIPWKPEEIVICCSNNKKFTNDEFMELLKTSGICFTESSVGSGRIHAGFKSLVYELVSRFFEKFCGDEKREKSKSARPKTMVVPRVKLKEIKNVVAPAREADNKRLDNHMPTQTSVSIGAEERDNRIEESIPTTKMSADESKLQDEFLTDKIADKTFQTSEVTISTRNLENPENFAILNAESDIKVSILPEQTSSNFENDEKKQKSPVLEIPDVVEETIVANEIKSIKSPLKTTEPIIVNDSQSSEVTNSAPIPTETIKPKTASANKKKKKIIKRKPPPSTASSQVFEKDIGAKQVYLDIDSQLKRQNEKVKVISVDESVSPEQKELRKSIRDLFKTESLSSIIQTSSTTIKNDQSLPVEIDNPIEVRTVIEKFPQISATSVKSSDAIIIKKIGDTQPLSLPKIEPLQLQSQKTLVDLQETSTKEKINLPDIKQTQTSTPSLPKDCEDSLQLPSTSTSQYFDASSDDDIVNDPPPNVCLLELKNKYSFVDSSGYSTSRSSSRSSLRLVRSQKDPVTEKKIEEDLGMFTSDKAEVDLGNEDAEISNSTLDSGDVLDSIQESKGEEIKMKNGNSESANEESKIEPEQKPEIQQDINVVVNDTTKTENTANSISSQVESDQKPKVLPSQTTEKSKIPKPSQKHGKITINPNATAYLLDKILPADESTKNTKSIDNDFNEDIKFFTSPDFTPPKKQKNIRHDRFESSESEEKSPFDVVYKLTGDNKLEMIPLNQLTNSTDSKDSSFKKQLSREDSSNNVISVSLMKPSKSQSRPRTGLMTYPLPEDDSFADDEESSLSKQIAAPLGKKIKKSLRKVNKSVSQQEDETKRMEREKSAQMRKQLLEERKRKRAAEKALKVSQLEVEKKKHSQIPEPQEKTTENIAPIPRSPTLPPTSSPKSKPATTPAKIRKSPQLKIPSNRLLIKNALIHVCLAGTVYEEVKKEVLEDFEHSESQNFIILFRGERNHGFRGLYTYDITLSQVLKCYAGGSGPDVLSEEDILEFYKYDSGAREFKLLPTKHFGRSVHAVVLSRGKD
ncbi:Calmodulin-regulated spectrin-associated protein 2 [Nowakowskiella sp. JEL0407]|nr:Calmodulin-regulated spectrin-associated protein 2 [Nowakowskiella sp. JEL0407]